MGLPSESIEQPSVGFVPTPLPFFPCNSGDDRTASQIFYGEPFPATNGPGHDATWNAQRQPPHDTTPRFDAAEPGTQPQATSNAYQKVDWGFPEHPLICYSKGVRMSTSLIDAAPESEDRVPFDIAPGGGTHSEVIQPMEALRNFKRIRPNLTIDTRAKAPTRDSITSHTVTNTLPPSNSGISLGTSTPSLDTPNDSSYSPSPVATNKRHRTTAARPPPKKKSTQDIRQWQNDVGKRYRDKLTGEFAALHAVLHMDLDFNEEDDDDNQDQPHRPAPGCGKKRKAKAYGGKGGGSGRGINKAKVLDRARERIVMLLEEQERMVAERERLVKEKEEGW
ncbi:hypothetical protein N0V88_004897 [Collariella sp. IMI 366227]|nr:hypothetical protein N0V88_004897 [Collariella sp. IMI 366227]